MEIKSKELRFDTCNIPEFGTTEDIEPYDRVIGQNRAVASIDLGLKMDSKEYNIFISGKSGTGKTGYIVRKIEEYAKKMSAPDDWCYVYNFDEPNAPIALSLKTGTGNKFKEAVAEFIKYLLKEVPAHFNSQNYESEKNVIIDKYEKKLMSLNKQLTMKAKNNNFSLKQTPTGEFAFIPMANDKEMTQDEYMELNEEEKDRIDSAVSSLRLWSVGIANESREVTKNMDEELKQLDDKIAESIIDDRINGLKDTYGFNEDIIRYIEALKKDIIENIEYFNQSDDEKDDKKDAVINAEILKRYEVNVIISNSSGEGAPVIFADSTQPGQLFGNIEFENKMGNLITDFTLIRAGYLHQANGGFLIIKANELLNYPKSWETLKRCINLEMIFMDTSKYNTDILPISTLKPKNIPLKTKVILLGSNEIYSALLQYDMDFEKLFKIKAEFDYEIESNEKNITNLIGFIRNYIDKTDIRHITRAGIVKLIKFSSRMVENGNYFSASMSKLLKIVDISNYYAKQDNSELIEEKHVKAALEEDEAMHGLIRKKVLDMYKSKKYVVELKGSKVGQINGLSVITYGDFTLGQQHKITVSTYAGRKGIINIEREANMSGNIHSKGIMILSGYVGSLIGQETLSSFNASIVFEQLYSGIEGDSASAAELIALLSSLADAPIKQSLAITGSVNQKGEIQPIGGVNDKIEGYFDICSIFGLDGSHGVIIPYTNLDDLVLKDKVIDAVEKGLFHIYTAENIEDCLEILCDDEFKNTADGHVMEKIKNCISAKLKKYNYILKSNS